MPFEQAMSSDRLTKGNMARIDLLSTLKSENKEAFQALYDMWCLYVLTSMSLCGWISLAKWPEGFCVFCLPSIFPVSGAKITHTCPTVACFYVSSGHQTLGHMPSAFTHWAISPPQNWIIPPVPHSPTIDKLTDHFPSFMAFDELH